MHCTTRCQCSRHGMRRELSVCVCPPIRSTISSLLPRVCPPPGPRSPSLSSSLTHLFLASSLYRVLALCLSPFPCYPPLISPFLCLPSLLLYLLPSPVLPFFLSMHLSLSLSFLKAVSTIRRLYNGGKLATCDPYSDLFSPLQLTNNLYT